MMASSTSAPAARGARALLACALAGCAASGPIELSVDLKTDYQAGEDFFAVRVELLDVAADEAAMLARVDTLPEGDLLRGARVAELTGLTTGSRVVVVTLLDATRDTVASRRTRIELEQDTAITVLIGSLCANVVCPRDGDDADATECISGRCVPPRCGTEAAEECGPPACDVDADCPRSVDCGEPVCVDRECFVRPMSDRCRVGERCDVRTGCARGLCDEREVSCDDGIDDDCDGLTDCEDPDCLGAACDDGARCTEGDVCTAAGRCEGAPVECDDNNDCTDDSCDEGMGCVHEPNEAPCDDGVWCNGADRCAEGTCSVHEEPPCERFCNEAREVCEACATAADCGNPVPGPWGTCQYASTCAQTGTRTRTVMVPACTDGACTFSSAQESEACTRSTNGVSCGTTTYSSWSACGGFANACATSGTRTRTRTDRICGSGTCGTRNTTETGSCTRTAPPDGTSCGSGRVCCGANNCVALTSDSHCGACRVRCAGSLSCRATGTGGHACRGCSTNDQCRAILDSRATCWNVNSPPAFCNCQCPSSGVCANGGCGAGFFCWACPGQNFCSPAGGSC